MTDRIYFGRLNAPGRYTFLEATATCNSCGRNGAFLCGVCDDEVCIDCECECFDPPERLDHYPVGDPDEIRLGRRVEDVDAGDLT